MKYTKVEWQGIVRTLLSAFGAFLVGRNFFGHQIDESYWQEIVGLILGIISVIWSIYDKTATVESIQGAIRQTITFVGGLLFSAGLVTNQTINAVLGVVAALAPFIQGYLTRVKNNQLETGTIKVEQLKK